MHIILRMFFLTHKLLKLGLYKFYPLKKGYMEKSVSFVYQWEVIFPDYDSFLICFYRHFSWPAEGVCNEPPGFLFPLPYLPVF